MQAIKELGLVYWILLIVVAILVSAGKVRRDAKLSKERESMMEIMNGVVKVAREKYNTESITLLKELEDEKGYLKYELLVEDKIKQAIYIKDTSEVVVID